uniref:Phospho-2-dehydro-3-deoxyheptonate aldolase n=4 Tax=Aegilops tauschii subsp. strangulata TaxID=200361 RepID=A0A453G1C0_AEGTS
RPPNTPSPEASAQSPGGPDWIPPSPPVTTSSVRVHIGETKGAPRGRRPALLLRPPRLRPPGRDCAGSFKEFNANNIRDTFRLLLQMGTVFMFGGQVPVVKVQADCPNRIGHFICEISSDLLPVVCTVDGTDGWPVYRVRSDNFEEKDGVKLPSYKETTSMATRSTCKFVAEFCCGACSRCPL